jgi:hypothetical protein
VGGRRGFVASRTVAASTFVIAGVAISLGLFGGNAAALVTHVDLSVSVTLAATDPPADQTYDSIASVFTPAAPTEDVTIPVGALDGLSDITLDHTIADPTVDLAGCVSACTLTIGGTATIPTPLVGADVDVDVMVAMRWADDTDTSPTVAIAVQVPDLPLSDLVGASADVDPDLGSVTLLIAPSSWGTVPLDSTEFPEGFGTFLGAETSMDLAQGSNLLAQIDVTQNAALEKAASVLGYTGSDPLQFSGVLDDTADPLFAPADVTLDHLSLTIPMPDAAPAEWLSVSDGKLTFASNAGTLHLAFAGEFTVTAGGVTNAFSLDAAIDASDTTTGVELHLALAPPQTELNLPSALDWLSISSPAIDLSIDTATHAFSASLSGDVAIGDGSVSIGIAVATGDDGTKVDLSLTSADGISLSDIADWLTTGDGPFAGGTGVDADALDHISLRAIQLSLENSDTAKRVTLVADASFDADTGASLDFGALLSIGQTTDAGAKHNTLLFALEETPTSPDADAEITLGDFLPDLAGTTAGAMRMPEAGIVLNQGGAFDTSTLTTEGQTVLTRALGLGDDGDLPDTVDHTGLQFFANLDVGWFGDAALAAMGIDPGDPTLHIEGALGFQLSAYGDPGTSGPPKAPAPLLTSLDLKASIPAASFSWLPDWVSMTGDWMFEVHYGAAAHAVELALSSPTASIALPDGQSLDGIQFSAKFKKQTLTATELTAESTSNASDDPCTLCTATKTTNTSTDGAADQTATFTATCDTSTGDYQVLASGISTDSWGASGTSAKVVVKQGATVVVTQSMPITDGAGDVTFNDPSGCEDGNQVLVTGPGAAGNLSLAGSFADETSTFTATCDTSTGVFHVVASGISTATWGVLTDAQVEILNPRSNVDRIEPMTITNGSGDATFTNGTGCVKGTQVYVTGPGADGNLSLAGSFGAASTGTGIDVSVTAKLGSWNEPFGVTWLSLRNFELDFNVSQDPLTGTTYDALLKGDIGLGSKTVSAELHVYNDCVETGLAQHPTVSFLLSLDQAVTVDDLLTALVGSDYPDTLGVTVPDAVSSIGFGPAALDVEVCKGAPGAPTKVKVGGTAVASFQPNADSTVGIDSMFSAEFTGGTLQGLLFGLKPYCAGPAVHLRDLLPDPSVLAEDSPLNFALCDPDNADTGFGFVVSTYGDGTTSTTLPAIVKEWMKPLEGLASDSVVPFTLPGPGFSVVASIRLGGDLGEPDGMLDQMGFDNKVSLAGTIGFDPVSVELAMRVNVKGEGLPDWLDSANVAFDLSLSVGPNPTLQIAIDGTMVARVKQGFDEAPDGISVPIADPVAADEVCPRNGVVRVDQSTGNSYCYDLLRVRLRATATISAEEFSFAIDASLESVLADGTTLNPLGWAPFGLTSIKIGSIHAQIGLEVTPEFGLTFALGGSIQLDLGGGHIINTFAAIKVEVTAVPPWILLDGFRLDVDRFGLSDIVQLYKDISGEQFSTDGIPDVSIHNLDLSFSPLGVKDFCIPQGFSLGGDLYVTDGSETDNGSSSTLYTCNTTSGVLTAPNGRNPAKVAACPDGTSDNGCVAGVHIKVDDKGFFGDGVVAALNFGPVHFRAPTSCGTGDDQISSPVGACFHIEITKTGALLKVAGGVFLGGTETAGYSDGYASGQFALNICAGVGTCPNSTGGGSGGLARLQFYGRVGFGLPSATSCTAGTGIFCFHALGYGEIDLPDLDDLTDLFSGASTSLGGGLTLHFELATKSAKIDTSSLDYANSVQGQIDAKFQSALTSLDQAKQWADKMATDPKGAIEDVKDYLAAHGASSPAVNDALTALQVMIDTNGGSLPDSVDWIFNGFTIPGIPGSITDCIGYVDDFGTCWGIPIEPTCFTVMVNGTCWFTPPIVVPGLCQDLDIPDASGVRCSQADVVKALVLIPIAKTVSGLADASEAVVTAAQSAVDAFVSGEVFGVNCASLDLQAGTTSLGSGDHVRIGMDLVVFGAPIKFNFRWDFDASWQTNANTLYADIMDAVSGNATVDTCNDASFDDVFGSGTSTGGTGGGTGGTTPAALINLSLSPSVTEGGTATLTGTFDHALESGRTMDVNWGDGSAIAHISVASVATTFTATHAYVDDNPTNTAADLMTVEAKDTSTGGATIAKTLYVNNVAPSVSTTLTSGSIDENGTTGLTVNFTDPGAPDTHTASVTWGDGTSTTMPLATGVLTTGQLNHQYKDNPVPAGSYTIGVTVADDDTGTGSTTTSIEVANVAPTVSTGSFAPTTVNEGDQVTFTVGWSDPGSLDGHLVQIDIDGNGTFDLATSAAAGVSTATFTGLFLDDDPTATAFDVRNIGVKVTDKDNAVSDTATIPVTVHNVTPVIDSVTPSDADEGQQQTYTALFHDRGLLDTHAASFAWGDGTSDTSASVSDSPGVEINATGGTFTLSFQNATTPPIAVGASAADVESALAALSTVDGAGNVDVTRAGTDGDYLYAVTLTPATMLGLSVDGANLTGPSHGALLEAMGVATADHTFVDDNPTGTASDPSDVEVTLTDDDTGSTNATDVVTVHNVAPTFGSLTPLTADEGTSVEYTLDFGDAGVADTHAVSIDWNDGAAAAGHHGHDIQTLATLGAGVTSTTVHHTFIDDDPTATTHDAYDVVVTITDDDTGTIEEPVTIDVSNVAPTITDIQVAETGSPAGDDDPHMVMISENTSVTLSGTFHDPGPRDTHTLTTGWGNEVCTQTTSGIPSCGSPQVTVSNVAITGFNPTTGDGTFSATATFGDNGIFPLTAWVTDDDGGFASNTETSVTVSNVKPRPLIDATGTVTGDNGDAIVDTSTGGTLGLHDSANDSITEPHESPVFLAIEGQAVAMSAQVTDPGSDDVTMLWNWDFWHAPALTTAPETLTSLVNDPAVEPSAPNWTPTVQPRSYDDPRTHTWTQPCLYTVRTTATDDDRGTLSDRVDIVVQNARTPREGLGWWWNETKAGVQNLSDTTIQCYLDVAGRMSRAFNEVYDAHTISSTTAGHGAAFYLNTAGTSDPKRALGRAILGSWLNFANGAFHWAVPVDTNGDSIADTPFNNVMTTAENVFLNKNSTKQQLLAQKSILLALSGA